MAGAHPIGQLIGARVAKARKLRGLTQEQLAAKLGVHAITLGRWEQGTHEFGIVDLTRICNALGVSPNYLLCWDDREESLRVRSAPLAFVSLEAVERLEAARHVDEVADLFTLGFLWHATIAPSDNLVDEQELEKLRTRARSAIESLEGFDDAWVARRLMQMRQEGS